MIEVVVLIIIIGFIALMVYRRYFMTVSGKIKVVRGQYFSRRRFMTSFWITKEQVIETKNIIGANLRITSASGDAFGLKNALIKIEHQGMLPKVHVLASNQVIATKIKKLIQSQLQEIAARRSLLSDDPEWSFLGDI